MTTLQEIGRNTEGNLAGAAPVADARLLTAAASRHRRSRIQQRVRAGRRPRPCPASNAPEWAARRPWRGPRSLALAASPAWGDHAMPPHTARSPRRITAADTNSRSTDRRRPSGPTVPPSGRGPVGDRHPFGRPRLRRRRRALGPGRAEALSPALQDRVGRREPARLPHRPPELLLQSVQRPLGHRHGSCGPGLRSEQWCADFAGVGLAAGRCAGRLLVPHRGT